MHPSTKHHRAAKAVTALLLAAVTIVAGAAVASAHGTARLLRAAGRRVHRLPREQPVPADAMR